MQHILAYRSSQDLTVALLTDMFKSGEGDEVWIPRIAVEKKWVIVTQDKGRKPKEKGRIARNSNKLPRLCLEYGVTHILVSQVIAQMPALEKCNAVGFAWDKILLVGNYDEGSRFSMKLSNFRSPLSCGIGLSLVKPNARGNNVLADL